jgi:hypothetical protein
MENRYISMAIAQLTNGAEYVWNSSNIKDIQWVTENVTVPTQKQVNDKILEIKAAEEAGKAAVQAKLEALGLTADDLRSIL